MRKTGAVRIAIAIFAVVVCFANLTTAQDCFDDPDLCAGPRSWSEEFDEDPLIVSPDDWQKRANNELPIYADGRAILDGSLSAWTLIDTADHFFDGQTWIHIVMDSNPATEPDEGAGWWVNAENEGTEGGFFAIYGVLARNADAEQEYRFGPSDVTDEVVPVAEGGVDVTVTLMPAGNDELDVVYSVTDATNETQTGEFSIVGRNGPGVATDGKWFTLFANRDGQGIIDSVEVLNQIEPGGGETRLWAGDADEDLDFDQLDLVKVQVAAKYLSGQAATWGEGDWDGAPGGQPGNPPQGNGLFDQLDIIEALGPGHYLTGPYAVVASGGVEGDVQTSIIYNPASGEVGVDAPAGMELTSVNIDSAAAIFTGDPAENLGGSFDNDADDNIFKATFGSSFGSLSFGNVAQAGLSEDFVANDLTVVGSLAGGGDLGNVDLIYIPEPSTMALLGLGLVGALGLRGRQRP